MPRIRFAMPEDAEDILRIYAPFIISSPITFELEIPSEYDMQQRIEGISANYPYLVCEIDNGEGEFEVAGYAYASHYKEKTSYNWNAEVNVYIKEQYQRCNIASALYYALIELLKGQGFYTVIALITESNEVSETFHTAFGFRKVGELKNVGYKLNTWHSESIYERNLVDSDKFKEPNPIIPISELNERKRDMILKKAAKIIKIPKSLKSLHR